MLDYLEQFHSQRIFNLDFAESVVGNKHNAQVLLNRYCKAGLLQHLRRNLYATVNLGTKDIDVNRFQIGSQITPSSYISHHSALEYHGLGHQVFNTVFVAGDVRFVEFSCDGYLYQYSGKSIKSGIVTPAMDSLVRVTDIPRTVIDCIDRIDKCGGVEELFQCLNVAPRLDGEKISSYLEEYDKRVLYKKVGFVLSYFKGNVNHADELLDVCRKKGLSGIDDLSSEADNVFYKEWGIYAPQGIDSII